MAPQSEVTKPWKVPVAAEDVAEEHFAGAGGHVVDCVVGAHEGVGVALDDGGAEGGEIGVPQIVRGGIDVGLVARGFGSAVDGVVLGGGDGAEVFRVVALDALDEGGAEAGGEEGIFAVGFLAAAPAGIAKDVDVGRPDGEAVVAVVIVVGDGVVVLGASFSGDDFADGVDERRVPGGGVADGLREHGGVAGARDAVEAFVPPVVGGDVEARDGRGAVDELGDFFFEGQAADEVVDALVDGERGIAEGERGCGFDLFFGRRWARSLGGSLSGCGERKKEGESEDGWMQAHEDRFSERP